jgi:hypothetical protein
MSPYSADVSKNPLLPTFTFKQVHQEVGTYSPNYTVSHRSSPSRRAVKRKN